jgi:hypothetical protein
MKLLSKSLIWFIELKNLMPIYLILIFKILFLTPNFWLFFQIDFYYFFLFRFNKLIIISNLSFLLCIYLSQILISFNVYLIIFDIHLFPINYLNFISFYLILHFFMKSNLINIKSIIPYSVFLFLTFLVFHLTISDFLKTIFHFFHALVFLFQ